MNLSKTYISFSFISLIMCFPGLLSAKDLICKRFYNDYEMFRGVTLRSQDDVKIENSYMSSIEVDKEKNKVIYDGSVSLPYEECGNENWMCFSDGTMELAVPRQHNFSELSWNYRGMKYTVIPSSSDNYKFKAGTFISSEPLSKKRDDMKPSVFYLNRQCHVKAITLWFFEGNEIPIQVTFLNEEL